MRLQSKSEQVSSLFSNGGQPLLLQIFSMSSQCDKKKNPRARSANEHARVVLSLAMTSPPYPLCGCSESLITGALIRLFVSWQVSPILNRFDLPPLFQSPSPPPPPSLWGDTKTLQVINALTLGSPWSRWTSIGGPSHVPLLFGGPSVP